MEADERFWNREELYEEVWSVPMRALAKKYGISDVGLAKVCRKLQIPLPGRGHWEKKAAGQDVQCIPLPAVETKISVQRPAPRREKPPLETFATEQERAQIERLEQSSRELVLKRGDLSHPLVAQARAVLAHASADDRKILLTNEQCLDIRVSKGALDRALRIMATLISAIESEGFAVEVGNGQREHTAVLIGGQHVKFGLVERVERVALAAPPPGGVLERVLNFGGKPATNEPSGQLSIEIWHYWGEEQKRWKDGKSHRLEELIARIMACFIRIAAAERVSKEKQAAEQRESQRRAEERAQLHQRIKAEESRVRALHHATANWLRAEHLRSFVSAARDSARQGGQPCEVGTQFGNFLAWAEQQADRIDPLKESPTSILDRKGEVEPAHSHYYGYQKPDPPFRFPKPVWRIK